MDVKKIIVHSLVKNEGVQQANSVLSENLLPIENLSVNLIKKLDLSYRIAGITYAVFDNSANKIFPTEFKKYLNNYSRDSFIHFSKRAVENLRDMITNIAPAKGGFLVFSEYTVDDRNFFSVYLIRDTLGMLFKRDTAKSSFFIDPTKHLDLDKLAMACRINISKFHLNQGRYLSFIKRKMPDISEYFINWVSATDRESNKIYTQELYDLTNIVECPKDEHGETIARDLFKKQVFDYIKSAPSRIININELSRHFYDDETYLSKVAEENDISLDTEFQPDRRVMKKFVRIDLESDGIHIRFSRGELNRKIRFDEQNRNVVIIESEKFASDLRKEIDQYELN